MGKSKKNVIEAKEGDIYITTCSQEMVDDLKKHPDKDGEMNPMKWQKYDKVWESGVVTVFYIGDYSYIECIKQDSVMDFSEDWLIKKATKKQRELYYRLERLHKLKD